MEVRRSLCFVPGCDTMSHSALGRISSHGNQNPFRWICWLPFRGGDGLAVVVEGTAAAMGMMGLEFGPRTRSTTLLPTWLLIDGVCQPYVSLLNRQSASAGETGAGWDLLTMDCRRGRWCGAMLRRTHPVDSVHNIIIYYYSYLPVCRSRGFLFIYISSYNIKNRESFLFLNFDSSIHSRGTLLAIIIILFFW